MNKRLFVILIGLLFSSTPSQADYNQEEENDLKSLQQTQELLRNKASRESAAGENASATMAHDYAKSVGGSEDNTQAIYGISADVLEVLVKKYKGDPTKMNEVLLRAQQDPEGFAKSELTPEQLDQIKALSQRVPAKTKHP